LDATEVVKKVVMVVKALAPEKIRHDLLGKVFHELIPFEVRKAVAAFYTNNEAAEILAQLAIDKPYVKVMDLACGSGTLLVSAYRRKRELLMREKGEFTLEDHKRFLEQELTGIDIMSFAAHMAVVHLALQALAAGHEAEKVRIAVWDSTELEPGQTIPAISRELKAAYKRPTLELFFEGKPPVEEAYVEKGAVTLEGIGGEQIPLEKADVVIMNPPFTRQERLSIDYKNALVKRLKGYENYIHGQLGLYGYFVLLADKFVKNGGRIALVLPASILRIQSAYGIRKLLINNYQIEYILTTWQRAAFSESAQFREILLIARKLTNKNLCNDNCVIVKLQTLPTNLEHAIKMADKIKFLAQILMPKATFKEENLIVKVVSLQKLKKDYANLFKYIASQQEEIDEAWNEITIKAGNTIAPLKEVLKDINGKIYEGARARTHMIHAPIGSLFILQNIARASKHEDLWIMKEQSEDIITAENLLTHNIINIPKTCLRFGLRRLSGVNMIDLSEKLDFILVDSFKELKSFFLDKMADHFMKEIPVWRKYIEERLSRLAVAFRFDVSAKGTTLLAWYSSESMAGCGVVWNIKGLSKENAKLLSLWFNSTVHILQIYLNRVETRGAWMQFHKYVMDDLLTIHPSRLSDIQKAILLKTFEEIKDVEFPCVLEQLRNRFWARVEIDRAILKVLGFKEQETNQLLDYLYPALTKEIEQLKTLMQG
jgi:molybdopterin converting factor small subunit